MQSGFELINLAPESMPRMYKIWLPGATSQELSSATHKITLMIVDELKRKKKNTRKKFVWFRKVYEFVLGCIQSYSGPHAGPRMGQAQFMLLAATLYTVSVITQPLQAQGNIGQVLKSWQSGQ